MRVLIFLAALLGTLSTPTAAQVMYPPNPAIVQSSGPLILDSAGNATWTYDVPFPGVPDMTHIAKSMDSTNVLICNYTSLTATAVAVNCKRTALLGLLTGLLGGATTGGEIRLIARYKP